MFHSPTTVPSIGARYCTFQDRGDVWPSAKSIDQALPDFGGLSDGLLTGSLVATEDGWRAVETLSAGDKVLTFDHGLRTLAERRANPINRDPRSGDAGWGLTVPSGAIGNRSTMAVLPSQLVLLECDYATSRYGDPFILVPAGLLTGYKGIARTPLADDMQCHMLAFDDSEIVHSHGSALLACFATRKSAARAYPCVTWAEATEFRSELFGHGPIENAPMQYNTRFLMAKLALAR